MDSQDDAPGLFLIGLGLGDEEDVTVRGLRLIRSCSLVFLEHYTSILSVGQERLEQFYGVKLTLADRDTIESQAERLLEPAKTQRVALLVVGDPFGATTHADLMLRARRDAVRVVVVHNASIMNAVACCGLQLYAFGQTVSIPFFDGTWRPASFMEKLAANRRSGLHTLCLLDIKVKEQTTANLMRGNNVYEPPRFMSIRTALEQMLEVSSGAGTTTTTSSDDAASNVVVVTRQTMCVGMARVGQPTQLIVADTIERLLEVDFGAPLHSLVVPAPALHDVEREVLALFKKP